MHPLHYASQRQSHSARNIEVPQATHLKDFAAAKTEQIELIKVTKQSLDCRLNMSSMKLPH